MYDSEENVHDEHFDDESEISINEMADCNENYDSDDDDDDEEEEDEGYLYYLSDKSLWKQHFMAFVVALLASTASFFHFAPGNLNSTMSSTAGMSSKDIEAMEVRVNYLKPTPAYHHQSYHRTSNLDFCLQSPDSPKTVDRVRAIILNNIFEDGSADRTIDTNLVPFTFNLPKEYVDLLSNYFLSDYSMDDNYSAFFESDWNNFDKKDALNQNSNYLCMLESAESDDKRSTLRVNTVSYVQPNIQNIYLDDHPLVSGSVSNPGVMANDVKKLKAASLSHTGFAAKFVNLSTKPLNLYWDSKNKPKLLGVLQPFEALGTVTTPGNSFHVTPTYDKSHAIKRWTMTADEPVVYYDPVADGTESPYEDLVHARKYKMHKLNNAYGREYLAVTRRPWLGHFPRPVPMHHMWSAEHFDQIYVVKTSQTHFTSLPLNEKESYKRLTYTDYDSVIDVPMQKYRNDGLLDLKLKVVSVSPKVFEIDNFLSDVEIKHILALAKRYNVSLEELQKKDNLLKKSQPSSKSKKHKNQISTDAWLYREFSPIMDSLYRRASDILKIDESLLRHRNEYEHTELNTHHSIAEATEVVRQVKGQKIIPHHDFLYPSVTNRYQPARFATILIHLNDDFEGGETTFPLSLNLKNHDGLQVEPKKGKGILFYNSLPDGNFDDSCQYGSNEVLEGEKLTLNLRIWDPIID